MSRASDGPRRVGAALTWLQGGGSRRWHGTTLTRERVVAVGAIVVLLVLGIVLPYVTVEHFNGAVELVRDTQSLFGASALLGGLDPTFLPSFDIERVDQVNLALNVAASAPGLQEVATIVALVTCAGLLFEEINKFFWWPLHVSGYLLVLAPVMLFVGLHLLRSTGVTASAGVGWVPGVLAGVVVLVATFRSHGRIDTYGGF